MMDEQRIQYMIDRSIQSALDARIGAERERLALILEESSYSTSGVRAFARSVAEKMRYRVADDYDEPPLERN